MPISCSSGDGPIPESCSSLVVFTVPALTTVSTRACTVSSLGSLPTVYHGLRSGKVSPIKVLRHHKLPDQGQVRRIYKEIESKDERLELNLYIVGEAASEDEGATAEGSQES